MSRMGAFILDVQTAVCDNFNQPLDKCKEAVYEQFIAMGEPEWKANYARETAEDYYNEIVHDVDEFSYLVASERRSKHI